jgi:hypothetical protein
MGLWDSIANASWNPFRTKSVILDDQNFMDSLAAKNPVNQEFGDVAVYPDVISKAAKNASRLLSMDRLDPEPQQGRAWYDLFGKLKDAAPDINGAVSSTLTKVIILVIVVSVIALFGVSYVNAKANQLALAK